MSCYLQDQWFFIRMCFQYQVIDIDMNFSSNWIGRIKNGAILIKGNQRNIPRAVTIIWLAIVNKIYTWSARTQWIVASTMHEITYRRIDIFDTTKKRNWHRKNTYSLISRRSHFPMLVQLGNRCSWHFWHLPLTLVEHIEEPISSSSTQFPFRYHDPTISNV